MCPSHSFQSDRKHKASGELQRMDKLVFVNFVLFFIEQGKGAFKTSEITCKS